jgi:hypothetical protein
MPQRASVALFSVFMLSQVGDMIWPGVSRSQSARTSSDCACSAARCFTRQLGYSRQDKPPCIAFWSEAAMIFNQYLISAPSSS